MIHGNGESLHAKGKQSLTRLFGDLSVFHNVATSFFTQTGVGLAKKDFSDV